MIEDVDSFAQMFAGAPGERQRASREARAKKERRTQLTAKQRRRGGVRTTQINFRCSPEFVIEADQEDQGLRRGYAARCN